MSTWTPVQNNCGTGKGGFKPGNTCARGSSTKDPDAQAIKDILDEIKNQSWRDFFKEIGGAIKEAVKNNVSATLSVYKQIYYDIFHKIHPQEWKVKPSARPKDPVKAKAWDKQYSRALATLAKSLPATQKAVGDKQAAKYHQAVGLVLTAMPTTALRRINANIKRYEFYDNIDSLSQFYRSLEPEKGKGELVAGLYNGVEKRVALDKGYDQLGTYAHELSHAIDMNVQGFSGKGNTYAWERAWKEEIVNGNLTNYAKTSKAEGFAEFGRALYASDIPNKNLKQQFPKCYALFTGWGFVEE